MDKQIWEDRYSSEEYIFGKEPNDFFKEEIEKIGKGRVLLVGDGEGRNAVYAARLGWEVDSIDISEAGKHKALKLAEENGVKINYCVADATDYEYRENYYDVIALIYFHLRENVRESLNKKILNSIIISRSIKIINI